MPDLPADQMIAICAFRYALGRRSLLTSHVGRWLIEHREKLLPDSRTLIVNEIREARERGDIGVRDWRRVEEAMSQ